MTMHKKQLEQIKHHVQAALLGSNWQGLFTPEIRDATVDHRKQNIAKHLEIALNTVDTELKRCDKAIERRRAKDAKRQKAKADNYRPPYKEN